MNSNSGIEIKKENHNQEDDNMDLKDEFLSQTNQLWIGNFSDKRRG